ncbi:MAG: hypothetical protein WHT63_00915 [Tepidiforma sp.]
MTPRRIVALLAAAAAAFAALAALPAAAQIPFAVSAIAPAPVQPGQQAAVTIRIEGQVATLPGFIYDVQGGTLVGVLAPTPVAANVAEGTVFVRRDTPGTASLSVSFAGQVLASANVTFAAATGAIRVETLLDAGPDAAARTWRYQVVDAAGAVVAELQVGTSGDAPLGAAVAEGLPAGAYAVRQVLGADTALACAPGAFYAVSQPAGAVATVTLGASPVTVRFTIVPCPDLPAGLEVIIPVDTIVPGAGSGIIGDAVPAPAEPPFSEVAGVRQPGPGLLPPAAGNSPAAGAPSPLPALLAAGALLLLSGSGLLLLSRRRSRPLV